MVIWSELCGGSFQRRNWYVHNDNYLMVSILLNTFRDLRYYNIIILRLLDSQTGYIDNFEKVLCA